MTTETIIHFETMWKPGLSFPKKNGEWSPTSSVSPLLFGIAQDWGCKYIYRQVHNIDNLKTWCGCCKNAQGLGDKKYIWLSGHGGDRSAFKFHNGKDAVEVSANKIVKAIESAGPVNGVIIDACSFGGHLQKIECLPKNTPWVLAAYKAIDLTGSFLIFVKALEWITEGSKDSSIECFKHGLETDNENKKKNAVNYSDLVKTIGIRFYYQNRGFLYYPED